MLVELQCYGSDKRRKRPGVVVAKEIKLDKIKLKILQKSTKCLILYWKKT